MLYEDYIKVGLPALRKDFDEFPCILRIGTTLLAAARTGGYYSARTPSSLRQHLHEAIDRLLTTSRERLIFIRSWNEWAEGNYLGARREIRHGVVFEACQAEVERGPLNELRRASVSSGAVNEIDPASNR